MAPSSYGAATWQKVVATVVFGSIAGLSATAWFRVCILHKLDIVGRGMTPAQTAWILAGFTLGFLYLLLDVLIHRYVITEEALMVFAPWGKRRIFWKDITKVRWRDVKSKYPYPVPVLVAANGWEILYPRANLLVDMPAAETERALFWNEVARRAGDKSVDLDLFV